MRTPIEERNGVFVFDLRMPKGKCCEHEKKAVNTGRFQALMEDERNSNQGFARQADLSR